MSKFKYNRRDFLKTIGLGAASLTLPGCGQKNGKIKHIITLSFDDGFKKSSIRTAEIYEKYNLSACFNVIASGHLETFQIPDEYQKDIPKGDFGLWNELKKRGHEIMPHGYKHANKKNMPFNQAKDLILRCLDIFSDELEGFDPQEAIFNFPYNSSTPELEGWLPTVVKAFRTGGGGINPFPYKGQVKLTCTGYGPGNIEQHLENEIEKLLAKPSGWLIYNTHGLDGEGYGPMNSDFLDKLLKRLSAVDSVKIMPTGQTLSSL